MLLSWLGSNSDTTHYESCDHKTNNCRFNLLQMLMFLRSFEATCWREKEGIILLRRDSNRGLLEFRDPDNTNSSQSETFLESDDNVKVLSHRIGAAADTDADADADADAECFVNGQQFKHDELIPSEDKCRSCSCQNGQVRNLLEVATQGP